MPHNVINLSPSFISKLIWKENRMRPWSIRLESCSICQLRCQCCPNAKGWLNNKIGPLPLKDDYLNPWEMHSTLLKGKSINAGYLKLADFKKLVDKNPWIKHIELSNWGEIFLNQELKEIIEYAHTKGIILTAENGVNLNTAGQDVLEALVRHNFLILTCSIDGATAESYEVYHAGGNLEAVILNIKKINSFKKKYKTNFPVLVWKFTVFGHNEDEISGARKIALSLGMRFMLQLNFSSIYSPVKNRDSIRRQTRGAFSSREEFFSKKGVINTQKAICSQLWNSPQINWDGRLLGCCVNYWDDFGKNVFENNLTEALESQEITYAKDMLLGKKAPKSTILCSDCIYYKIMKKSGDWLTNREIYHYDLKNRIKFFSVNLFKDLYLPRRKWI